MLQVFPFFSKSNVPLLPKNVILLVCFFVIPLIVYIFFDYQITLIFTLMFFILEYLFFHFVYYCRKRFPWLIIPADAYPDMCPKTLDKFIDFGFDPEIGWIRKPLTQKSEIGEHGKTTVFHINNYGGRANPAHEALDPCLLAIYGDSFAFSRQVNDNESIQWYLSKFLGANVHNFGVGNYGFDQSLLRFRRLRKEFKTKFTIFCHVPSTIVRIHDLWKHYNEFGNIYGFKPRFVLDTARELRYIPNTICSREDFMEYVLHLDHIQRYDLFYRKKFLYEMLRFPYLMHAFSQPRRNFSLFSLILMEMFKKNTHTRTNPYPLPMRVIMENNLALRRNMYNEEASLLLLQSLTSLYIQECAENNTTPILLWIPQKDDVLFIKKTGNCYYKKYINWAKTKLLVIDATNFFLKQNNIDIFYCDDTNYGGHLTSLGNKSIAAFICSDCNFKDL